MQLLLKWMTFASTLLWAATVVLWVRSYHVLDLLDVGVTGGTSHTIQSILGRLHVVSDLSGRRVSGEAFYYSGHLSPSAIWNGGRSGYPVHARWHAGCIWQRYEHTSLLELDAPPVVTSYRLIVVPYGYLAAAFALPPVVVWGPTICRRRRRGPTDCHACGYDLRATPRRCPECGFLAD